MLQKSSSPGTVLDCMLPSLSFRKRMTVPRQQLWSHLRRSATPSTLLSVIKHMYENDEYILMDGEKRARVHPTNGVNRGALCPPSFLFVHQ